MYRLNSEGVLVNTDALGFLLDKVQFKGNHEVKYKTDKEIYGVTEKWAYPKFDNLKLVGDCEDISIYKRKLLIEAGVPKGPLLLTICLAPGNLGHCVLSVVTHRRDYILCNGHDKVVTPLQMKREGYKFLYRQKLNTPIDQPWDVLG